MLTNAGLDYMARFVIGESPGNAFNNANARIAVGSSTTPHDKTDTALVTEITRVGMDIGYPTAYSAGSHSTQFRATFADGVGNGAWNEWGIVNLGSAGTFLNRVAPAALGSKAGGQTWTVTATLTFSVGLT